MHLLDNINDRKDVCAYKTMCLVKDVTLFTVLNLEPSKRLLDSDNIDGSLKSMPKFI